MYVEIKLDARICNDGHTLGKVIQIRIIEIMYLSSKTSFSLAMVYYDYAKKNILPLIT